MQVTISFICRERFCMQQLLHIGVRGSKKKGTCSKIMCNAYDQMNLRHMSTSFCCHKPMYAAKHIPYMYTFLQVALWQQQVKDENY